MLKVISYNIWNGFEWGEDKTRHDACVAWIRAQNADVVALQELSGYDESKLRADAASWGHAHVELLKTDGYPVGVTSREPIALRERRLDGLWHGMLHAETAGIEFFVIHLSPADVDTRFREAGVITERVRAVGDAPFLILGDYNSHSPIDHDLDRCRSALLERYRQSDAENETHNNLRLGEFDVGVLATFLALPAVDVVAGSADPPRRFSYPAPALIGQYGQTAETVVEYQERIDYILASPELATRCTGATIVNTGETDGLSDHYPVVAQFEEV